jgi:hypothetical protein
MQPEEYIVHGPTGVLGMGKSGVVASAALLLLVVPIVAHAQQSAAPTTLVGIKGECQKISLAGNPSNCAPGGGVLYSVLQNGRALITFPLDDGRMASFVGEKDSQPNPETYYLYLSRVRILSKGTEFAANIAGLCIISMSRDGRVWSEIGCQATDENNATYEFTFQSNGAAVDVQHPGAKSAGTAAPASHVDAKVIAKVASRFK